MKRNKESGVTILESAILFVVFSAFVIGAVAIVDYIQESRFVRNALERELSETAVKPFRYEGGLQVNSDALQDFLQDASRGIEDELQRLINSGEKYYIELIAAELEIDPRTGVLKGNPAVISKVSSGSSNFIPSELLQRTSFKNVTDGYIKNAKGKDAAFIYASPTAFRQASLDSRSSWSFSPEDRYLPKSVIIFGRVFYGELNSWPLGYLKNNIGLDTVYHSTKVVTLRGDI